MKSAILATVLFAMLTLTCQQESQQTTLDQMKLTTVRERFSYGLGYDFGPSLEHIKSGVDLKLFMRGIEDYLNGQQALVPQDERTALRSREFHRIGQEYLAKKKEAEEKNLAEGEAFLTQNKAKSGVVTTASGLQYQVLAEGNGPKPGLDDRVKVKYRGTFTDGREFESTEKRMGKPSTFLVKGVIAGWTEGFQLMPVGSTFRFFVPANLAYGKRGREPDIPPNAVLIFEIELLEIVTGKE